MTPQSKPAPTWLITAAFAATYLIWGSTYLAIRFAIEGVPPFVMAGSRFITAGLLVGTWLVSRGEKLPTARQWLHALLCGTLMLAVANGGVTWSEQHVPSGIIALFGALAPLWMAGLDMVIPDRDGNLGKRPTPRVITGLVLGTAGLACLVLGQKGDFTGFGEGPMAKVAIGVMFCATIGWAVGSMLTRRIDRPSSTFMATAAQMIAGGLVMLTLATARGEFAEVSVARMTYKSVLSFAYLVIFGSIIALTAYTWLLGQVAPSRVATSGYVNPVVAVAIGWALAGEPITAATAIATVLIVVGVAMIVTPEKKKAEVRNKMEIAEVETINQ